MEGSGRRLIRISLGFSLKEHDGHGVWRLPGGVTFLGELEARHYSSLQPKCLVRCYDAPAETPGC